MKPKGRTPSLLAQSTGKPFIDTCGRKTKCTRCKDPIVKGDKLFKIPKLESGFTNEKPFCLQCVGSIIEQTKKDLQELEAIWTDANS